MKVAFDVMDPNKDGNITNKELKTLFAGMKKDVTDEEI